MAEKYNEQLYYQDRCLRTLTGKLLFGPAGNRLAVDILDRKPGFLGCIDFIHKANITQLCTVSEDIDIDYEQSDTCWYPTHMVMSCETDDVSYREIKTIIKDDVAAACIEWENRSDREMTLTFCCEPEKFHVNMQTDNITGKYGCFAESPELRFGISIGIAAGWSFPEKQLVIAPREKVNFLMIAAVGNMAVENREELWKKTRFYLSQNKVPMALIQELIKENEKFYSDAPAFLCDDKLINACWKYRWYILKNSMCRPEYGVFKETVMYEGRDHRMAKTPLEPKGWEFSKLIPLSTPLQVNDLRWHTDRELTKEIIRSAFAGQDEKGLLLTSYVQTARKSYANYMIWAIWLFYLLDGDKEFIRELVPGMKKYISGHEEEYQDDKDGLLIERTHALTGKEYQPSYWYFHDFPKNPKDPAGFTPLKRVDRSVYHYLNLCGLSKILRILEDEEFQLYQKKAENIKKDINCKMWDEETGFYYDLHYSTEVKAMVKNIVGVYPFWADIDEEKQKEGIRPLMDKEMFDVGSAFPSVSKDCPAFSPAGGWMGNFIKGRNGCVWCGPSWPYTTGIALEALGNQSRKNNHCYDKQFDQYLKEYTIQHFRDGNYRKPYLVEHYNPITGERLSDEADYNHSFWLDIIISYVAGIVVKEDGIEIDPLKTHLKWFCLDNLDIRGHKIKIEYSEKQISENNTKGLTVFVDGKNMEYFNGSLQLN